MDSRAARVVPFIAAFVLVGGCANPLGPIAADNAPRVPPRRLQTVDTLGLTPAAEPKPSQAEPPAPEDRFKGLKTYKLTLEEARAAVLRDNLDLRVAMINPTISEQSVTEEEAKFEAVFRPSIQATHDDAPAFDITASNTQDSVFADLGVDIPLRTGGRVSVDLTQGYNQTSNPFVTLGTAYTDALRFSISQPLLRNAGRRTSTHTIRIAQINEQISRAQTKLEVIRQIAAADRAFWQLYAARRELTVRQQQYELAQTQLDSARRRKAAGDVAEIEVIQAEAGVAERLEAIILAENTVLQRQRDLKRLMNIRGLGMETPIMIVPETDPEPVKYNLSPLKLASAAVDNRMEMLQLELQLTADISSIDFARNQALPLFTLDYSYWIQGLGPTFRQSADQLANNHFQSWQLGLSAQIPIGNEAAKSRLQSAIITRLQRLSSKEAQRLSIRQEVFDAVDSAKAGWQRILATRQATIAAARAYEAEQNAFKAGGSTSQNVLDQAARLADAQSSEITALTDYQISLVDLAFATGTLLGASKVEWSPVDPRAEQAAAKAAGPPRQ